MKTETKYTYRVKARKQETDTTATIKLELADGGIPKFVPGQYITVYFPETGTPEGKAYSLSSAPSESAFAITVKAMGEFSNRLVSMNPGDTMLGSLPYGYFYTESTETPLVMVAAGIGVSPFRSVIKETLKKQPTRKLMLFHSVRTLEEAPFFKEFQDLAVGHSNLIITHCVTRGQIPENVIQRSHDFNNNLHYQAGRITAEKILLTPGISKKAEYMLCGSIAFTRDLWRGLRALGVPEEAIYTEAFFTQ